MGVPALFRWLSKKYPKIVLPVHEATPEKLVTDSGEEVTVPVDISRPNPNGVEFDNLYLDMNGIVHPCTHPEGKPAPETEEEMMIEIFNYTERVVNMIRPRKLLFMAIDGVAPRAKMNQQRSRRFRAAQEAKDKEEARLESFEIWEAMGKTVSAEEKNKKAWDSNAITPGTPFMDLLARSLRYWVVQKINTDPGWKNMQVYISDASVPGEGEHKIMDFIRRQRSNPGHDPNTQHVIYGLDADLIMLSLATHEPHFRVLREDVFFQDGSKTACRICGEEGHYAAQCTGEKKEIKKTPPEKKPFIFLDVAILREYLEVELDVPQTPFTFDLERAIDDWVLLIFFVGNDFLPHLPSLEIREGAIDTLLKIWRAELPRMGGYLTDHGQLEYKRVEIILEGLARREDDIFRRRREAEERQDQEAKRRKTERSKVVDVSIGASAITTGPSPNLQLTANPAAPPPIHPSLPQKPQTDFALAADSMGLGSSTSSSSAEQNAGVTKAIAGSNHDWVANRAALRMANMNAAEALKAEMAGLQPLKPSAKASLPPKPVNTVQLPETPSTSLPASLSPESIAQATVVAAATVPASDDTESDVPGLSASISTLATMAETDGFPNANGADVANGVMADKDPDASMTDDVSEGPRGVKRKIDESLADAEEDEDITIIPEEDDAPADAETATLAMKVNADGTVEQEDFVKLWEPGYKERYYRQKFGVEYTDTEFKKQLTKSYVEGMAWVLHYYYQGTPSWQWYYPYHFAPFAADFEELEKMDIKFNIGSPFKPFEQLMGVFPAASRKHIPEPFQRLMTDEDSPIIDFYPTTFQIDMNGKKMAWQGVALLPFIDEKRLLDAMSEPYNHISDDERHRNKWGNNFLFVGDENGLYPTIEALYGKRKDDKPVPINPDFSRGINGSLLPDPACLPGSTYYSPIKGIKGADLPDIPNDRSLSALYFFPKQLTPHRSVLLRGTKRPARVLNANDLEVTRQRAAGTYRGRGGGGRGGGRGGSDRGRSDNDGYRNAPGAYASNNYGADRTYSNRGGNTYGGHSQGSRGPLSGPRQSYPPQQPPSQVYGGYGNAQPPTNYNNYGYGGAGRGGPPPARGDHDPYASNAYGAGSYGRGSAPPYRGGYSGGGYGGQDVGGYGGQGVYNNGNPPNPYGGGYGGYGAASNGRGGGYGGQSNGRGGGGGYGGYGSSNTGYSRGQASYNNSYRGGRY